MAIAKLTPDQTTTFLARGIEHELLNILRGKVQVFRDQIVQEIDAALEQACRDAASSVVAHATEVMNTRDYHHELHFHFALKQKERNNG